MNIEEIFSFENLYKSHIKCRKTKQHKGEVIRFEVNISENLYKLQKELFTKKYKLGKYKQFIIYEPKKRLIEALPYKDRIVIMCFCDNVLKKKLEKRLINDNVACRTGKGTKYGIDRLTYFLKKEYFKEKNNDIYYLKCDIKKYFPSIDHEILLNLLSKVGFSKDEMWFLNIVINSEVDKTVGLPLGNQTSQWFAIFFLNRIDRLIKEELQIKGYVRYMDDFILIHRDKKYLQYCLKRINEVCNRELNLELNNKTQIGVAYNGIDFLGFRHTLTSTGKVITKLRLSAKKRLRKHIKVLNKLKNKNVIDDDYYEMRMNAFSAHLMFSDENYYKRVCQKKN